MHMYTHVHWCQLCYLMVFIMLLVNITMMHILFNLGKTIPRYKNWGVNITPVFLFYYGVFTG